MKSRAPRPQPSVPNLPLLVEIGCEEIPSRFLAQAEKDFGEKLQAALEHSGLLECGSSAPSLSSSPQVGLSNGPKAEAGLPHSKVDKLRGVEVRHSLALQTYSTPRRLVAYFPAVLAKQSNKVEEITGPPVKVAFDAAGKPTRAAESFAFKNGTNVAELIRVTTPKGEYLAVKKTTPGRSALELLSEILPSVVMGLAFPKSMYWVAKAGPRFARPIRWVLALLGEGKRARVVPFEIAGVKAGDTTYGHRNLGRRAIRVQGFNDYAKKLRESQVEFDPAQRREGLRQQLKVLIEESNIKIIPDPRLEDWIVHSTEWPRALLGGFEERFLKLPREILITVMRDHQKYFAVEDQTGNLQPRFVTVLNVKRDPKGLIRAGHERVLTARFRDAEFFWDADLKVPLEQRLNLLAGVTYQAELGSYAEKVGRMKKVAAELCRQLEAHSKAGSFQEWRDVDTMRALLAVDLCKVDLTTRMVQEFPELEGIVGGLYARAQRLTTEVPDAIYDHYLPKGLEDRSPRTPFGAVVSLADKIDGIVAGFAVGNKPTGSSDPFALRRQGNGVIKIILEMSLPIRLDPVVDKACEHLQPIRSRLLPGFEHKVPGAVLLFLRERLDYYLKQVAGVRYDTVRAVLTRKRGLRIPEVVNLVPFNILRCARDLERIRSSADFLSLSQSAKRIRNILLKSAKPEDFQGGHLDPALLQDGPERGLYKAFIHVKESVDQYKSEGEYYKAFESIASLRPAVDLFFDKVLVMAEDSGVRMNRLQVLLKLDSLFADIADLSEIESAAELPSAPEAPAHRELKAQL